MQRLCPKEQHQCARQYQDAQDDFDEVLERVVSIVQEPRTVWKKANLALKQAIQRIVFPKPLIYAQKEKKFRNVECAGVYRFFEEITPQKAGLVVWRCTLAHPAIP